MKKKFYVLRVKDKDLWIAHKGPNKLTSNRRWIHVFKEHSLQSRLEHTARLTQELKQEFVSEDW